ncbi:MAG: hypothetical protein K9K39_07365 [Desulfohalobiaceae bacterium]|nr:hypothetical protein [Desulfohalobiaceae bacterium]
MRIPLPSAATEIRAEEDGKIRQELMEAAMPKRVSLTPEVAFTGGVAQNVCLLRLLQEELKQEIVVPDNPDMTGALGAALLAAESDHRS